MGLIVDTNVFIDAENGCFDLSRLERYSEYGDTYIAAITVAELYLGVHLAADDDSRVRREAFVEALLLVVFLLWPLLKMWPEFIRGCTPFF